jgi:hypothetical protein
MVQLAVLIYKSIRFRNYTLKGKVTLRYSSATLRRFAPTLRNSAVKLV